MCAYPVNLSNMFSLASFRKRHQPCGRRNKYYSADAIDTLIEENKDTCVLEQRCRKLHVIVICMQPWEAIPGATPNPKPAKVNQPPAVAQVPISGGLPINLRLAAKPVTVPRPLMAAETVALPEALYNKYGEAALSRAQIFSFEFAKRGIMNGEANGQIVAMGGKAGSIQASVDFVYRWCGPKVCKDELLPVFDITDCSSINARFVVLGDVDEFLPTFEDASMCSDAFVVLGLQQWCCAEYADQVQDVGTDLDPVGCDARPLSCTARRVLGRCDPA